MIHWTPEATPFKVGLNVYWTKQGNHGWWFRLVWYWYDAPKYTAFRGYFRFRSWMKPHIIKDTSHWNVIDGWKQYNDVVFITRAVAEDYVPGKLWN